MKTTEERSVSEGKKLNRAIRIDEAQIRSHLDTLVRDSVEDTLNKLLDSEADRLCNARRYEHSEERTDRRAGHYPRKLQTRVGEVQLKMPRLRQAALDTLIIERYRRKEASIEESLVEMYLAGLSVRTVEDMSEQLVGSRVSASTVSDLNQKIYQRIELWRNRPIEGSYPYVYLDGIYLKRSWGGEVRNVAILVAVGVNEAGFREILGICEGAKEDLESWKNFLCHLKQRGLKGVQLVISDKCLGLLEALGQVYPEALWQRCMVHWYRNVFSMVPSGKVKGVAAMLKAIHAQEDKTAALAKAEDVMAKLKAMKLGQAAEIGRKNWLFAGSEEGASRAAIVYSLVASCKLCGIDPFAYFRDVLDRVSTHPASWVEELTPPHWQRMREQTAAVTDPTDAAAPIQVVTTPPAATA